MIKVEEYKEPQHGIPTEKFFSPQKLYLPLVQHTGKPSKSTVKKGDTIEEGDVIALEDGLISTRLHAPKKGKIFNIENISHPVFKRTQGIIIECDKGDKNYSERKNIESLGKDELIGVIRDNGVVGMGGAAFPTHVKLTPPKSIDTLIINGCECEPYLATDYRLMIENKEEIFRGIEILCKILNPKKVIFAIEDNKPEAIKKINLSLSIKKYNLASPELSVLNSAYPQGGEKQLIYSVTKRKIPPGKLPLDVGCLVHNVATVFTIYKAVYFNQPLIERLVCFAGDALVSPKNIWVKIGTTLKELFDTGYIKFKTEPKKIICGGPMMGVSLDSLDYPVLKGTGGFLFLKEIKELEEMACIRCARCVDACPMTLLPLEYVKLVKKEKFDKLQDFYIKDCIECGSCSYVCPAKIPIVHYIKLGKKYLPN